MVETQNELQTAEARTKLNDSTFLQGKVNELEKDLEKARECWREEFDKRKELKKELNSLGQGTGFIDVEKLRKDINKLELEIYNTRETIRTKTEALENEKAIDNAGLQEVRNNLRNLKIECEDKYKKEKKRLDNKLKTKRHNLIIDETMREQEDMNKGDWKDHVNKVLTKADENAIPLKLEELHQEHEKKIQEKENIIQEMQDAITTKYSACEEEIRKLKQTVEQKKITLHNLEMGRENRLEFAGINHEIRIFQEGTKIEGK
jgi:chromosome segregation ATPase